jgi:hypothetical protein
MMIDDDDDDDDHGVPILATMMISALGCAVLFWLPLLLYACHWWMS